MAKGWLLYATLVALFIYCHAQNDTESEQQEADSPFCAEVRSFTPNFCSQYSIARTKCSQMCQEAEAAEAAADCRDQHANCAQWAANGHCERSDRVMNDCKRSCSPDCNGGLLCGRRSPDGLATPPSGSSKKKKNFLHQRVKRIVNGTATTKGEWPWQVSLRVKNPVKMWCAGAILSRNFILTAAHCFYENVTSVVADDWFITAGDYNYLTREDREQNSTVRKIIRHDGFAMRAYNKTNSQGMWGVIDNDVAILQLNDPIEIGHDNKGSLCLPDASNPFPDGTECHIVGWGHTQYNGTQAPILQEAKVLTVPLAVCNLPINFNHSITDTTICAGFEEGGVDACQYDSGGSMVCDHSGRWYSNGIVSSGYECARPNGYGLYTNVPKYKEWIVEKILTEADT